MAAHDASWRDSVSNVQALCDRMERMLYDYEEKLDSGKAAHEASRRDSESNVQALRDTMERMRNDYEDQLSGKVNR